MLMRKIDDEWVPWTGEVIDNTGYPLNIETLWSVDDLNKIGLYFLKDDAVPEGKIATDWSVVDSKSGPVRQPELMDTPPKVPTLDERVSVIEKKLGIA
ncbi:hypothetical protein UFOVP1349_42 [uncultured Caudovirales phage]|uniref:Uncharacterized protein n=3 Tax=uncultured Caudovirales phage TaxID=2100421 RepID=A0A6J5SHZ3_9CAUD|nr:hypothetical protein UFOVP1097_48 [uncultured Caudovirales phage]CAB4200362.1 hypothetical protein UFOVP1349_42 [uncultured Caudovirales phage]CAB4214205.1 hypothetical protein UFOVP1456_22 [uncultured Caudovirales phage]